MTSACQCALQWGYPTVYCAVHAENTAAIELYTNKLAFRIIHEKKTEKGEVDYVLRKSLVP